MSLALPWNGCGNIVIDIPWQIIELFRSVLRVAFKYNSSVFFGNFVDANDLVNIERLLLDELRKFLSYMIVIGSSMNYEIFLENNVSDSILSHLSLDCSENNLIRVLLD